MTARIPGSASGVVMKATLPGGPTAAAVTGSPPLSDRSQLLRGDPEGIHYQGVGERAWETKVWQQLRPQLLAHLAR